MNDTLHYLDRVHPQPNSLLLELERRGHADGIPIVSREVGRFLATLVHAMQANRILEIGTAYGYSTLWMALAQPPVGTIWTIDVDVARTDVARSYFERAGEADSIEVLNQSALEVLENFPQRNVDIVFIDADKLQYRAYLDLAIPCLKRSGLIVVDNLLWHGLAAQTERDDDTPETRAIRDFNRYFLTHPDLAATIVPFGDGTGVGARVR
jgi:predicted O-methyltransferase YrrM